MANALPLLSLMVMAAAAAATAAAEPMPVPDPTAHLANGSGGGSYAHFFSFGDSQIDTGNFIHYYHDPALIAGHFPYGETFFHRPTGRNCDGRVIVDFIVERLGFPYWPPYLTGETAEDFRYGANLAVCSATVMDPLFYKNKHHLSIDGITPYSLGVQIDWLKKVLATLGSTDQERREIMASSLFLVGGFGTNDYFQPINQNRTLDFVLSLVPLIIDSMGLYLESLIQLGAKTLYVPGVVPLGCVPRFLFQFRDSAAGDYDPATGCLRWLNGLAARHNALLRAKLAALRRAHGGDGVSVVYADYYGDNLGAVASPARKGFDAATVLDQCCGGGGLHNANYSVLCAEPGYVLCPDPSRYVSWDGLHNTEAMHEIMVGGMLDAWTGRSKRLPSCPEAGRSRGN